MRNLITRAVFDKTFRAGDKFKEPDWWWWTRPTCTPTAAAFNFMDRKASKH